MKRCSWVEGKSELYINYHDKEWGIPVYDDNKLFEMLILEIFQSGLNWITILKKRDEFRKAFDNFNPEFVAAYGSKKFNELLQNPKIIRNKSKIKATIENAKVYRQIQLEFGSFSNYIWNFTDGKVVNSASAFKIAQSQLSDIVTHDLKRKGMCHIGSKTIYSFLQAMGVINDHEIGCFLCGLDNPQ